MEYIREFLAQFPVVKVISVAGLFVACLIAMKLILLVFDKFVKRSKLDPLVCKIPV